MSETKQKTVNLRDDNFYRWKFEISMLLRQKSLFQNIEYKDVDAYIIGKMIKLSSDDEAKLRLKWSFDDDKAMAYIGSNVDPKYYSTITNSQSAYEIWKNIAKLFEGVNTANKLSLKVEFYNAKQQSHETLLKYLDRILFITDKLQDIGSKTPEFEICIKVISSISSEYLPIQMACIMLNEKDLSSSKSSCL